MLILNCVNGKLSEGMKGKKTKTNKLDLIIFQSASWLFIVNCKYKRAIITKPEINYIVFLTQTSKFRPEKYLHYPSSMGEPFQFKINDYCNMGKAAKREKLKIQRFPSSSPLFFLWTIYSFPLQQAFVWLITNNRAKREGKNNLT